VKLPLIKYGWVKYEKVKRFFDLMHTIRDFLIEFAEKFLETYEDDTEIFVSEWGNSAVVRVMDAWGNEVFLKVVESEDCIRISVLKAPKKKSRRRKRKEEETELEIPKDELRKKIENYHAKCVIDYYA